jgi:hypothetical protein
MTVDWKEAASADLEDHVSIYQPESIARACGEELARIEWEEDMELQRRQCCKQGHLSVATRRLV